MPDLKQKDIRETVSQPQGGPPDRLRGILLGTAVGDALGLPAEALPRPRVRRFYPHRWRHRFCAGRGMISDDTEHTFFVAQCLLGSGGSADVFAGRLGGSLRWWLLSLPAGVGWATLRSTIRLSLGVSPSKSGVYSAGNGPAMRSAIIGAYFADDPVRMQAFVMASTVLTHTDPRAFIGANAVAAIAAWIVRDDLREPPLTNVFLHALRSYGADDEEWLGIVSSIEGALERGLSVEAFADTLGLEKGVSGYIYHTVPVVLYAWYRHFGDFEKTLSSVLNLGGDTDTTGAIVGALAGATVGERGIPGDWIDGIIEWPRSTALLRSVADALSDRAAQPVRYFWPGCLLRNLVFTLLVLMHGFRRLFPPYK